MQKQSKPTPDPRPSQAHFLAIREVASQLGVHERTVWRLLKEGKLAAKKLGERTLISLTELDRYIAALPDWQPESVTDHDSE